MAILFYHAVQSGWSSPLAIEPETFRQQCQWLARYRKVVDLPSALALMSPSGRLPRGVVSLTFDDGFSSVYDHAFPILRRYSIRATVFLVAGTLDRPSRPVDWVKDPPVQELTPLTLGQVLEMQDGGILFGSHGYSHRNLAALSPDECERDLRASRNLLEEVLNRPVRLISYPGGYHNEVVRSAAQRVGYSFGLGTSRGRDPVSRYGIPRIGIYPGNGFLTFRVKTASGYVTLRRSSLFAAARALMRGSGHLRTPARPRGRTLD